MIEQEMVFALGFLTAGLLALACLPAVWRRAIRLTTRRLTQLVPLSMEEIAAERDGLRAGFAVEQRRLEQRLERLESGRSEMMADLGRRDARVAALDDAAVRSARRIADLTRDLDTATGELRALWGEAGTSAVALHDLTGLVDRQRWDVLAADEKVRAGQSTIDGHRATIASLETRIIGLDTRMADLDGALGNSRAELARTIQAVGRASAERDAAILAADALRVERDTSAEEATGLKASMAQIEHRVAMAMQAEAARAMSVRLQEAEAEKASLLLRLAEPSTPGREEADLAVLRETLKRVADDVLRLTERDNPPPDAASALPATPLPVSELSLPN